MWMSVCNYDPMSDDDESHRKSDECHLLCVGKPELWTCSTACTTLVTSMNFKCAWFEEVDKVHIWVTCINGNG